MKTTTINIDTDVKCAECGQPGACQNGICLACSGQALSGKRMRSAEGQAVAARIGKLTASPPAEQVPELSPAEQQEADEREALADIDTATRILNEKTLAHESAKEALKSAREEREAALLRGIACLRTRHFPPAPERLPLFEGEA